MNTQIEVVRFIENLTGVPKCAPLLAKQAQPELPSWRTSRAGRTPKSGQKTKQGRRSKPVAALRTRDVQGLERRLVLADKDPQKLGALLLEVHDLLAAAPLRTRAAAVAVLTRDEPVPDGGYAALQAWLRSR